MNIKYTNIYLAISLLFVTSVAFANDIESLAVKAKGKETIELRFNGRMQLQYDGLSLTGTNPATLEPSTSHFYFRRLFLGTNAKLSNGIFAETVLDFAGDDSPELNFDKAILGYKFSNGIKGVLGFQKVPFGYEETTSSSKLQTIERSAVNRFFADDIDFSSRHTGIFVSGKLESGILDYSLALVNAYQGEGSRLGDESSTSNELAYFARLQHKGEIFTLGYDYGSAANNEVIGEEISASTAYLNYNMDDINFLGEYFEGDLGASGEATGYSIRASSRMGKWEPVLRYSSLETDNFNIDTDELIRRAPLVDPISVGGLSGVGEINSKYAGLNYYYSKAVTFLAGYEQVEVENELGVTSEVDGLRARVQILW